MQGFFFLPCGMLVSVEAYLGFAVGCGSRVLLQELEAQPGDLLLDADHDVRVVLIAPQLIGQSADAVPHKVILPCQIGFYGLEHRNRNHRHALCHFAFPIDTRVQSRGCGSLPQKLAAHRLMSHWPVLLSGVKLIFHVKLKRDSLRS